MSLPSGLVEFRTQSLADEIRQALEEERLMEDLEPQEFSFWRRDQRWRRKIIFFLIWLNEC